ncbi:MAG: PD-(D/E)XK nuclease family protein, partial [Candidatus Erginobacter occultus]|nr:PD-(D/E)XK nuclease family protein [Candidatus Erginobacter occultus]
ARKLVIYPTSRALRQLQRRALEKDPFFDGRGRISLSAFLGGCEEAARLAGLLKDESGRPLDRIDDLKGGIAVVEAAERFSSDPPLAPAVLGRLSRKGLEETLEQLIAYLSPLAGQAEALLDLLAADLDSAKNRELAALYRVYREVCRELGVADPARINAATLRLLGSGRDAWPSFLRPAGSVTLAGVRWVGPFVELVIRTLEAEPDPVPVTVSHILESHEQDWWGRELMTGTGKLIFGREEESDFSHFERSTREALDRIREGYAMCDPNLAGPGRFHIAFSSSVGRYGEVEDLARRIVWETRRKADPLRPEEICLAARDLGPYADAIRSVFPRFGIPFNFRRGLPVLSSPVVKVALRLLELSATGSRDAFCALLESPWPGWGDGIPAARLADDIRRSGVEPEIASDRELRARLAAYYRRRPPEGAKPEEMIAAAERAWRRARGPDSPGTAGEGISDLLRRLEEEFEIPRRVGELASETEGSADGRWGYLFNGRAYGAARRTLELLKDYSPAGRPVSWEEISRLVSRGLEGLDVFPLPPDESGVWILSPHDIGGLKFKLVIVADLTSGSFPRLPLESPIFSDRELEKFRDRLGKDLPATALAASRGRSGQENLLFLTTLAAASERIVVSAAARDEQGREVVPSVFYSTLWRLAGWPAFRDELPPLPPDPYDRYRVESGTGYLAEHWLKQRLPGLHPGERSPFPGESFAGTVPLELAVTAAERRRALVRRPETAGGEEGEPGTAEKNCARGLRVERWRSDFFRRQAAAGESSPPAVYLPEEARYSGDLGVMAPPGPDGEEFSVSELNTLVRCPYAFYLERIFRLEEVETNELEPSPLDYGSAVHAILERGFAHLRPGDRAPSPERIRELEEKYRFLRSPAWALREGEGWALVRGDRPEGDVLPLALIEPASLEEAGLYLEFFSELAERILDRAETENWRLGVKEQLGVERRRIVHAVRRIVALNFLPPGYRNHPRLSGRDGLIRATGLIEFAFGGKENPIPPVFLADPGDPGRRIAVRGKIDRVDLIFAGRKLEALAVIDYKGASKAGLTASGLGGEIAAGLNCQLPVYGLAARDFFGNGPAVIMQYLSYSQSKKDLSRAAVNHWIGLEKEPLTPEQWGALAADPAAGLLDPLRAAVFRGLARLRAGKFLVDPAGCESYCRYRHLCRYDPGVLAAREGGEDE